MRKRLFRVLAVIACGGSFQMLGCDSQNIGDIVASGVRDTAVEVSTFATESLVDQALGLN